MDNPFTFSGIPVYTVQPKIVPVLQISKDFKWLTVEARAKHNAYLLKTFGTRDESAIPFGQAFMFNNAIFARPEMIAAITNIVG